MTVFMDDILIIGNWSFEEHLDQVWILWKRLLNAGIHVNPLKSYGFQEEAEYRAYVISREGMKPQQREIEKMLPLKAPENKLELRSFVGTINYYSNMWQGIADALAPLTKMSAGKETFVWDKNEEKDFKLVKKNLMMQYLLILLSENPSILS